MLEGKNIILKPVEFEDLEFLLSLINNQELAYWEGRNEKTKTLKEQEEWFLKNKNSKERFIIQDKNTGEYFGYLTFVVRDVISNAAHIALKLTSNSRNKGVGTDSLKLIMSYAFNKLNIHRLFTHIIEYNEASLKLFLKCNWQVEGKLRKAIYMNGQYHDNILVSILRDEYYQKEEDFYKNLFKYS